MKEKMEVLLTAFFLETVLLHTVSHLERKRRKHFLTKWAKGEMTMKELLWLKRQPWFQGAFQKVKVESAKKND
jgi:hypothetical protein